jgi:hypothetical protein
MQVYIHMRHTCVYVTIDVSHTCIHTSLHMARFQFNECIETRSWEDIARQGPGDFFETGGVAGLPHDMLAEWSTWACWRDHPCLSRLQGAVNGKFMCYVYNDLEDKWYPWAVKREIDLHASCPA